MTSVNFDCVCVGGGVGVCVTRPLYCCVDDFVVTGTFQSVMACVAVNNVQVTLMCVTWMTAGSASSVARVTSSCCLRESTTGSHLTQMTTSRCGGLLQSPFGVVVGCVLHLAPIQANLRQQQKQQQQQ